MPSPSDAKNTLYCSFCGKSQHEVKKLIAGPSVFICNECTELCMDILREEGLEATFEHSALIGPSVSQHQLEVLAENQFGTAELLAAIGAPCPENLKDQALEVTLRTMAVEVRGQLVLHGTPEQIAKRLAAFREKEALMSFKIEQTIKQTQDADPELQKVRESIRALERKLPAVQAQPSET